MQVHLLSPGARVCLLQPSVHAEINRLRRKTNRSLWNASEDAVLRAQTKGETLSHALERSPQAVLQRRNQLDIALPTTPFPSAIFDPEAPPLQLKYSEWTPLDQAYSIPPEAEVDWANACARIPQQWPLTLAQNNFDLLSSGSRVQAETPYAFKL